MKISAVESFNRALSISRNLSAIAGMEFDKLQKVNSALVYETTEVPINLKYSREAAPNIAISYKDVFEENAPKNITLFKHNVIGANTRCISFRVNEICLGFRIWIDGGNVHDTYFIKFNETDFNNLQRTKKISPLIKKSIKAAAKDLNLNPSIFTKMKDFIKSKLGHTGTTPDAGM